MKYVDHIKMSRAELLALAHGTAYEHLDFIKDQTSIDLSQHEDLLEVIKEYLLLGDHLRIGTPENYPSLLESAMEGSVWTYPFEVSEGEDYVELKLPQRWFTKQPVDVIRKHDAVAIDFGTKSTVVAIQSQGDTRLLRVGVENWRALPTEEDYENSSILQVKSNKKVHGEESAWSTVTQRPPVYLDDIKHANIVLRELEDALRDSDSTKKLAYVESLISGLKSKLLTRSQQEEIILDELHRDLLHVTYGEEGEFDAIEYYAWLLGLHINLNREGFFPRYYLSFPVDFPKQRREAMCASFKKGILRSLPEVIRRDADFMERFDVSLYVSEPAAFAASAIMSYEEELEPESDDKGTFFAVFDVGGGTSDYFFGNHRWSTEEGDEAKHERVLESYGTGGQRQLGGEHLLSELAFLLYTEHAEMMITHNIPFEPPVEYDRELVQGTSHLLLNELTARANRFILENSLRPMFHVEPDAPWITMSCDLFSRDSQVEMCHFTIPYDRIFTHLAHRFVAGTKQFLRDLLKLLNDQSERIHRVKIIRSGNTSRSVFLQRIFDPESEGATVTLAEPLADEALQTTLNELPSLKTLAEEIFSEAKFGVPNLTVLPLLMSSEAKETNPNPTIKTGTALGILQLIPGSELLLKHIKEDLFMFDVGVKSRNHLKRLLYRGSVEQGWVKMCEIVDGGANIFFTLSNEETLRVSDSLVHKKHITSTQDEGVLWVRPDGLRSIACAVTTNGAEPQEGHHPVEVISLDM